MRSYTFNPDKYDKTPLEQVIFIDPHWFFTAMENGIFNGRNHAANRVKSLATRICVPEKRGIATIAEYARVPEGKFISLNLITDDLPRINGSVWKNVIDLSMPYQFDKTDRAGYDLYIRQLKGFLFGSPDCRLERNRCLVFFRLEYNFLPEDQVRTL